MASSVRIKMRRRHRSSSDEEAAAVIAEQPRAMRGGVERRRQQQPLNPEPAQIDADQQHRRNDVIADLVQSLLSIHTQKGSIRENDLKKILSLVDRDATSVNARKTMIADAGRALRETFGLELISADDKRYFIRNAIKTNVNNDEHKNTILSRLEVAQRGLLYALLAFIYMGKNPRLPNARITEDQLWHFLENTGIRKNVDHPLFGDVKKLIAPNYHALFVAQGWIAFNQITDSNADDTGAMVYNWGARAHLEFDNDPMPLLEKASAIMNVDATKYTDHYEMAVEKREQTANADGNEHR